MDKSLYKNEGPKLLWNWKFFSNLIFMWSSVNVWLRPSKYSCICCIIHCAVQDHSSTILVFFGLCFVIHILVNVYVIYSYQLIYLCTGHQQYLNNSFKIFSLKVMEENKNNVKWHIKRQPKLTKSASHVI